MYLRDLPLAQLNSATKYPSIETYHELGQKGRLVEGSPPGLADLDPTEPVYITEKIDGTNARIVLGSSDYFIGSRENLLRYSGDVLFDPAMGIAEGVGEVVERNRLHAPYPEHVAVLYGEFYGFKIGAASKQYTAQDQTGFRLFDVALFPFRELERLCALPVEEVSARREKDEAGRWLEDIGPYGLRVVPPLGTIQAGQMPTTLTETSEWLRNFRESRAALDTGAGRRAEGVVVRTANRQWIRKLRFEDYSRSLNNP